MDHLAYDLPLILAYHSVSAARKDGLAVHPARFEGQMRWLAAQGYRSLTLRELLHRPAARRDERVVVITFDDGYADTFTQAFPILQRYGFTATVFLVAALVGCEYVFWWDEEKVGQGQDRSLFYPLTWAQIEQMAAAGFEFGSHTCTHPRALTALEPDQAWEEIQGSRQELGHRLGSSVATFCYPRGDLDDRIVQMVALAGYDGAVVTPPRTGIPLGRFTLRRISLYREYTQPLFQFMTTRFFRQNYEGFKRLRRILAYG